MRERHCCELVVVFIFSFISEMQLALYIIATKGQWKYGNQTMFSFSRLCLWVLNINS